LAHSLSTARLRARASVLALIAMLVLPSIAWPNGSDLPPEIVVQGFVKQEGDRIHVVVRLPLVLLATFGFPKRGPGYLDLARMEPNLRQAAAATGQQIEIEDTGKPLTPTIVGARVSPLSDRSFQAYESAIAHMVAPPLAVDTDLFWNQGFFDAELVYKTQSTTPLLSLRVNIAPEMGARLKFRVQYLPAAGTPKQYQLTGATGWVPLDPRWYDAATTFARGGFLSAFTLQSFLFLLCLIAPFSDYRKLLAVVIAMTAVQAITATAVATNVVVQGHWLPAVVASSVAAASLLLAIGNLASPSLRRRWFVAAFIGGLVGFGLGQTLIDLAQYAGEHRFVSILSFHAGLVAGNLVSLALAFIALRVLIRAMLGDSLGVIVLSAALAFVTANTLVDGNHELAHELGHAVSEGFARAWPILLWLLPPVIVGAAGFLLPIRFESARARSLRDALLDRQE